MARKNAAISECDFNELTKFINEIPIICNVSSDLKHFIMLVLYN